MDIQAGEIKSLETRTEFSESEIAEVMFDKVLTREAAIKFLYNREHKSAQSRMRRLFKREGMSEDQMTIKERIRRERREIAQQVRKAAKTEDPADLSMIYNDEKVKEMIKRRVQPKITKIPQKPMSPDDILYEKIKASQRLRMEIANSK